MSQGHHKTLALHQKSGGAPSDGQMSLIRAYTLRDFAADELVVREFALAHNCIDRDKECFDEALLANFADTLPGKGIFIKHPTSWQGDGGPGEGRIFEASLEQMSLSSARTLLREPGLTLPPDRTTVTVLKVSGYFAKTADNTAMLTKMDAGIVADVSVGFNASERNRVKGADGIELNVWRWVGPGEGLEMSLIWLGAQPGARATKNATRNEDNDMDLQKDLDTANGKITTLTAEKAAAEESAAKHNAIKTAMGASAPLLDNPTLLVSLITAGKAYRDGLVEKLVAADRVSGDLGDDEPAVTKARGDYAEMSTAVLEKLAKHAAIAPTADGAAGLNGGEPNAPKPGDVAGNKSAPAAFAGATLI